MADVFVGFFFDEEKGKELLATSKVGISIAANQYQEGFLSGLPEQMEVLSTLSVGAFPRLNSRLFFKREEKQSKAGKITYLPFINVYFIRDWMFRRGVYRALKKIVSEQAHTSVYVYSLNVPFLKAMGRLKRHFGEKIDYCLIIPDLPGKYGIVRKGIKGLRDRLEVKPKMELPKWADRFVFLTEEMKTLFPEKPYTVVEGFLPQSEFDYNNQRIPKTILYTGSLNKEFGIQTLLDAFALLPDEDYHLWICGGGGAENEVREAAKKDPRIHFKGFLPKSEITALQTQCDVLINPRPAEGAFTKYSFPSKTMEYLLSGSKVVMYKLPGIGDEYYRYIRTIQGSGPEAMAQVIAQACGDSDFYQSRWQEQVHWIQENKNAKQQVQRILQI